MAFCSMFCCVQGSDRKNGGKKEPGWRIFSLKELQLATNNFNYDNKLGEGTFGSVYWGQLWDGSQIAVKRLRSWKDDAETDFSVEIEILSRIRHKNLLALRGYSAEGQERIIVCDYMTNLSLHSHLHGQHSAECQLDWSKRMSIAIGVAEGIAYLHHHATPRIIHRNIKASNILLDGDFNAKVAEFGYAKFLAIDATHVGPRVAGEIGYLDPEYAMSGKASEYASSDVYSFGVLLLVLVTGKRAHVKATAATTLSIIDYALPLARKSKFDELVDPRLGGKYVEEEWKKVFFIGLTCTHNQPEKRPTMLEVVELLKGDNEKVAAPLKDDLFKRIPVVQEDSEHIVEEGIKTRA